MPSMEFGYTRTEEFLQDIPDTLEAYDSMTDNSKKKEEAKKEVRSSLLSTPAEELLQDIPGNSKKKEDAKKEVRSSLLSTPAEELLQDIPGNSKKKEEAKKEIRSLLLSAPVGLTLAELEQDYCLFFGNKIPSMELGYASTEEFLQDIPDTVEVTYKGGTAVLTGVSDASTEHIQKMVSRQRLDTRKNWGTLKISTASTPEHKTFANRRLSSAYKESSRSRNIYSSPDQDLKHQAVHPVRDVQHADLGSNSYHRNLKTGAAPLLDSPPAAPLLDSPPAGPFSFSHHRRSPLLKNNRHAEPQSNSCHRNVRSPLLMDNQHADPQSHSCHRNVRSPLLKNNQHAEPHSNSCHRNVRSPLLMDNQHAEPQSNSCHRNVRSPLLMDNQHAEPHSNSCHRNVRSPLLMDNQHAKPQSNSCHRNVRSPLLMDNQHVEPHSNSCHRDARKPLLRDIRYTEPQSNTYRRNIRTPPFVVTEPAEPRSDSHHRNDIRYTEPQSNTYHRNIRTPPFEVIKPGESRSDYHHKNARSVSPSLDNGHTHTRPQSLHRRGKQIPSFIRNKVGDIVKTHSGGIPLIHFSNIFHKKFGFTIDFCRLGYTSLFDFLSSLEDLVALKNSSNGETWVMERTNVNRHPVYNGLVDKHREMPEFIHKLEKLQFPRTRTIQAR